MARRRRLHRLAGCLCLLGLGAAAAWAGWEAATWPDVRALATRAPTTTAFIERYKAEERRRGRPGEVALTWSPYGAVSPNVKRAVLVAEDINFFGHRGFEWTEMKSAVQEALEEGERPRGASTITQQLAKNLWLTPGRNPLRKLKEAALTWQLERTLSKRRILELYLNVVEFGPGVYGIGAAARTYFGASASALDEEQSALLAASLPRPSRWHPGVASPAYRRYAASIRARMDKAEFLLKQI